MKKPGRHAITVGRNPRNVEKLRGGGIQVLSPHGVDPTHSLMIDTLPHSKTGHFLVVGDYRGIVSEALFALNRSGQVSNHVEDVLECEKTSSRIQGVFGRGAQPLTILAPGIPHIAGGFDHVFLVGHAGATEPLASDDILRAVQALGKDGTLVLTVPTALGEPGRRTLEQLCGEVSVIEDQRGRGTTIMARRASTGKTSERANPMARTIGIGDEQLAFEQPGGGLEADGCSEALVSLIDSAEVQEGHRLLSLGCGPGEVGISLAHGTALGNLTLVDSNLANLARARRNSTSILEESRTKIVFLLTGHPDQDLPDARHDLVIVQPPENPGFHVSEALLQAGFHGLVDGGICHVLTREEEWHNKALHRLFGNCSSTQTGSQHILTTRK